jgi:GNAT superfamily N-acetyltransferase
VVLRRPVESARFLGSLAVNPRHFLILSPHMGCVIVMAFFRRPVMQRQEAITIAVASDDEQILATRDVMLQLRPSLPSREYLLTVRRMMLAHGYRVVALHENGAVRAVAGYRFMEMLYCGKILYVDDLNTDEAHRSRGFGKALLDWLKSEARANGCAQLHLDSGVQRENTHRFYFREGLTISAYHFRTSV